MIEGAARGGNLGRDDDISDERTDALRRLARGFDLSSKAVVELAGDIDALRDRIAADAELSPIQRRARRKARIAGFKQFQTALRRQSSVLEEFPPRLLDDIRQLLASDIARNYSNAAFRRFGLPIGAVIDARIMESTLARYRDPSAMIAAELEELAEHSRRHAAPVFGISVVLDVAEQLCQRLQMELDRERLDAPDGRPVDRPRAIALGGLWQIYAGLTRSELPATPPARFIGFCAEALPLLGQRTDGFEDAARRLFESAASRRSRQPAA